MRRVRKVGGGIDTVRNDGAAATCLAQRDEFADEFGQLSVLFGARPIEPCDLVVLVVRIVVAVLGLGELVAGEHHRHAVGQHQHDHRILHLLQPQPVHIVGAVGRDVITLPPAVPPPIVVGAIRAGVPIRDVVFRLVADEVVQGESVVGSDEVDAATRIRPEQVSTTVDAPGEDRGGAVLGAQKRARVVTEAAVPLRPRPPGKGVAELIGGEVPRLGDQAHIPLRSEGRDLFDEDTVALDLATRISPQ